SPRDQVEPTLVQSRQLGSHHRSGPEESIDSERGFSWASGDSGYQSRRQSASMVRNDDRPLQPCSQSGGSIAGLNLPPARTREANGALFASDGNAVIGDH